MATQLARLTHLGRQAPPAGAGAPGRSPPSALAPSAYSAQALQVTQRHSHSDATTLTAITADSSPSLSRYDSDPRARSHLGSDLSPAPDKCESLSHPASVSHGRALGCLAATKLATEERVGLDPLGTRGEQGGNRGETQRGSHSVSQLEGRAVVKSSRGMGGASCSSRGDNSKTRAHPRSPSKPFRRALPRMGGGARTPARIPETRCCLHI